MTHLIRTFTPLVVGFVLLVLAVHMFISPLDVSFTVADILRGAL